MDSVEVMLHDGGMVSMVISCIGALALAALSGLLTYAFGGRMKNRVRAIASALFAVSIVIFALTAFGLFVVVGVAVTNLYLLVGGVLASILLLVFGLAAFVDSITQLE